MCAERVRWCEGDDKAGVGALGYVVAVNAGWEYMGDTRDSCVYYRHVLDMSVMLGVSGGGGMCEMCMRLARGGVGGVVVSGLKDLVWALQILWEHG